MLLWSRKVFAMAAKGEHLDMRCRVPGCKSRSRGPRFHFHCKGHSKLPLNVKLENMAKYRSNHQKRKEVKTEPKSAVVQHQSRAHKKPMASKKARGIVKTHERREDSTKTQIYVVFVVLPQ